MPDDRKTEEPTPRRLRRARLEGDHPTSRVSIGFGALVGVVALAPLTLQALVQNTVEGLTQALRAGAAPDIGQLPLRVAGLVAPPLGAAALGALLLGFAQTGGVLSSKPFAWDLQRLNPFARGSTSAVRWLTLCIALGMAAGLCVAAWSCLRGGGAALVASIGDGHTSLRWAARACQSLASGALAVWLVAALADGVVRYRAWIARHRMSREELRQEQREHEGDPALRRARERIHRELASGGASTEMAHASLLVFGAPRWAVALRYDPARDAAPRVLLRAIGARAASLHALAASHSVPIEQDVALAQALCALPLDEEVPAKLYAEVAQALRRAGLFRPNP